MDTPNPVNKEVKEVIMIEDPPCPDKNEVDEVVEEELNIVTVVKEAKIITEDQFITEIPNFRNLHRALDETSSLDSTTRNDELRKLSMLKRSISDLKFKSESNDSVTTEKQKTKCCSMSICCVLSLLCALFFAWGYFLYRDGNKYLHSVGLNIDYPLIYKKESFDPNNDIPVLIDFPGISNRYIPEILNECLGLKGMSVGKFKSNINQVCFHLTLRLLYLETNYDFVA